MIRVKVDAVFQVRDGFTGRVVEGNRIVCLMDGLVVRPAVKPGGYLVFTQLTAGEHRLLLRCVGYQDEVVSFMVKQTGWHEGYIALKPGAGYPVSKNVTRLDLQLAAKQSGVWITTPCVEECKIAQTKAEAGSRSFRIYCKGNPALLPMPGYFLIEDGESSEIVVLESLAEENGYLTAPLQREHSRSRRLLPVQQYRSDEDGRLRALFPTAGSVMILTVDGQLYAVELHEGVNEVTIP